MSLAQYVQVNTRYTRSVNIERDSVGNDHLRPYVLTTRAKQTLARILDSLAPVEKPRSWALIGPYGSGKSAFGLFLAALVAKRSRKVSSDAREILRASDPALYAQFVSVSKRKRPLCPVLITGSPDPMGRRLLLAMKLAAASYFDDVRAPRILRELDHALERDELSVAKVMLLLGGLQDAVAKRGGGGVLLVIDELGKFLEYEARRRGSDIFLLQALAEHSVRRTTTPLVFVALLHQAFEIYASRIGDELRNEWKKIGGRFESIPFLESAEQTIRIVRAAITHSFPNEFARRVALISSELASSLKTLGCLPSGLSASEAARIFSGCYPLHPVSLLLLPALCQRVAQNERTLFSYLGSQEPHGFLESLRRLEVTNVPQWICPADIYNYFILNQPGLTVDHTTHRRWAEVVTALERVGDAPTDELNLIRTIGLLNIVGAQNGMKASEAVLASCLGGLKQVRPSIQSLLQKSIVTFRRFSGEYRVWQGTDFDLEAAVEEQRAQIGRVDIAEILNEKRPIPPMVARRHTITSGTLRYFSPVFVSQASIGKLHTRKEPTAFFCIGGAKEETASFEERLTTLAGPTLGCIYPDGEALNHSIVETQALRRVQRFSQGLANDPVAQRELKDRLTAAEALERKLVLSVFDQLQTARWFVRGERLKVRNTRELQIAISELLDSVFHKAPLIRNELVNRDKPSSAAIAGRKKLFLAMLEHAHKRDLGIEKFPAEKAMYRSVLRATKLHVEISADGWGFRAPPTGKEDVARMRPAWDAVLEMLASKDGAPVSLESIYAVLAREPYGMKEGVLPILIVALYQAMSEDVALCEGGHFVPFLTQEILEGLLKTPAAYTLQRVHANTAQRALHSAYASVLMGQPAVQTGTSLIAMLQPLAKMMMTLPDYSRRTKRMSHEAIAVRDLFFSAKTPVQLLFSDIPAALGIDLSNEAELQRQSEVFARKLKQAIDEIKVAYHSLLADFIEALRSAFGLRKTLLLHELRDAVRGRCQGLEVFTIDQQGLKAFLGRLCDPYGDESQWVISVATFLARKPPEKWGDEDLQGCEFKLSEFVSRLNDLRQLQLHYERGGGGDGDFQAALVRLVATEGGESQFVVSLDRRTREFAEKKARDLLAILDGLHSRDVKLATVVAVLKTLLRPSISSEQRAPSDKAA